MSVVIPTFGRPDLIVRSVRSVLSQTYQDFEIIVVVDGPPDGTEEALRIFNDDRIAVIRHGANLGPSAARNSGIRAAKGKYIAFQDSDDEWLPEKLEKQIRVFEMSSQEVGVVYTERWSTSDNKTFRVPVSKVRKRDGDIHGSLLWGSLIGNQTVMVDAKCFSTLGLYNEKLHHLEDWELWLRMSRQYQFRFINEPLVKVYCSPDGIAANQAALIEALEYILSKHHADFERGGRRVLARQYYYLGNLLCRSGKWDRGRRELFRAIRAFPLNIKYVVAGLLALIGVRITRSQPALRRAA